MFSRLSQIKKTSPEEALVTADELAFPDSPTRDYFIELMGGFIHKHNNFLTVTQGFSQLLIAGDEGESVRKSAETIERSAHKAIDLNSRMLACTGIDAPKITEFDFESYFENAVRVRTEKRSIAVLLFSMNSWAKGV